MKVTKLAIILIIFCFLSSNILALKSALALDFYPNQIISNGDLLEYEAMNINDIQTFLNNQNGILKNFKIFDNFGIERTATEIIYNASQTYKVNPKWILATLQKEQSLVTNPIPTQKNIDWAMGYAVCDSCSVDDPALAMFKGFAMQVDRATWRIKYYYENPEKFNFRVGQLYNIDGMDVLPFNQATANLFNYTPHIHGNYNFWNIWNRWFAKIYTDGSLLKQEGQSQVYLISDGKRRPFWSKVALASRFDTLQIKEISRNDLLRYPEGYPIKYPNYS